MGGVGWGSDRFLLVRCGKDVEMGEETDPIPGASSHYVRPSLVAPSGREALATLRYAHSRLRRVCEEWRRMK